MGSDKQEQVALDEAKRIEYLMNRQNAEPVRFWCCPRLTPEQQREQDEYIKANNLPF